MISLQGGTSKKDAIDVDSIFKKISGLEHSYVTIGIYEDAGQYDNSDVQVYQVALWTEFGTSPHGGHPGTPEYAWMRSTIDENVSLLNQWREEMIDNIVFKNWTVEKALNAIGFRIQTLLQNKIKSNMPPPNAPSTQAAKARDGVPPNTLMHTELMLRSVTYKVVLVA